jgi:hypothetical protein
MPPPQIPTWALICAGIVAFICFCGPTSVGFARRLKKVLKKRKLLLRGKPLDRAARKKSSRRNKTNKREEVQEGPAEDDDLI